MSESNAASVAAVDERMGQLARGLMTGDAFFALRAYRALYRIGPSVIPAIRDVAVRATWPDTCRHEEVRYIAGLVCLVHDLDEQASRGLVEELARRGCGRVVERVLRVVTTPTITDYKASTCRSVRLFVHRDLPAEFEAESRVPRWLRNVPEADLEDVEMLFVTPYGPDDRAGDYMPSLCSIRVIWRNLGVRAPGMAALSALDAERTLYHEIGHHVHGHGFGQIPQQEKEADRYAAACFRRSHPFLSGVVGPLVRPIATLASRLAGQGR
jgi:hypothetical protein